MHRRRAADHAVETASRLQVAAFIQRRIAKARRQGYIDTEINREHWHTDAGQKLVQMLPRSATQAALPAELDHDRPPLVMVVDDSLTVRRVTQRLLEREGYRVLLAKDGVDALEQLQETTPDLMLVDIEMPRMDGFDLTRNVRGDERTKNIPIIMITSRSADKHRNYAMQLGVNAYFGKPFQEPVLLEAIAGLIKQSS